MTATTIISSISVKPATDGRPAKREIRIGNSLFCEAMLGAGPRRPQSIPTSGALAGTDGGREIPMPSDGWRKSGTGGPRRSDA